MKSTKNWRWKKVKFLKLYLVAAFSSDSLMIEVIISLMINIAIGTMFLIYSTSEEKNGNLH